MGTFHLLEAKCRHRDVGHGIYRGRLFTVSAISESQDEGDGLFAGVRHYSLFASSGESNCFMKLTKYSSQERRKLLSWKFERNRV
jgi:hypothetical protein